MISVECSLGDRFNNWTSFGRLFGSGTSLFYFPFVMKIDPENSLR